MDLADRKRQRVFRLRATAYGRGRRPLVLSAGASRAGAETFEERGFFLYFQSGRRRPPHPRCGSHPPGSAPIGRGIEGPDCSVTYSNESTRRLPRADAAFSSWRKLGQCLGSSSRCAEGHEVSKALAISDKGRSPRIRRISTAACVFASGAIMRASALQGGYFH